MDRYYLVRTSCFFKFLASSSAWPTLWQLHCHCCCYCVQRVFVYHLWYHHGIWYLTKSCWNCMRLLRCPPTCLRCGSFVASVLSNFEMLDFLCIWILMRSCLFHGQVFVIPTGVDAAMDAIQFALLACSSYDWASLERGFIVLQESLCRYHRRHASPTACMLSTSMTLLRRQRPWHMDDEEIALSVQRFLDAVSASLPHRFLGDEIVVIFFSCGTNMGSYFRFFLCVCVCGETLFLYVRTEAVQSEIGQSLDYTPGYVDVMDTPTFWAKNTPISPGTPPSASRIIPVFRQQAIPIVFCAGTLHSTSVSFQRKPTKRKAKECLQMSANFSERGSSNGLGVLNSCVLIRICPSSSSSNT